MAMATMDSSGMSLAEQRLKQLERLLLTGGDEDSAFISVETLIDVLLVLYDECCNSALRREKTVSDFIEMSWCLRYQSLIYNELYLLDDFIDSYLRSAARKNGK